jgi:hypothetical protein
MYNMPKTPSTSKYPKGLTTLANIVSYIFHPVFMPVILAAAVYFLSPASFAGVDESKFGEWLIILGFLSVFFPLFTLFLLKKLDFIESIQLHTAKDRIIPLIATMIFYFWANMVFGNIPNVPMILHLVTLSSFWGVMVLFMINIFFKVSMHTAAAGSFAGIMIVLALISPINMLLPFFATIIVAGCIGTARRILGAHGSGEIWLGYAIGLAVTLGGYVYLK